MYIAFAGDRALAHGSLAEVARAAKLRLMEKPAVEVLVFADETGRTVDIDYRGSVEEVVERVTPAEAPRAVGRPKLGVVAREVTLLPRHWDWLASQPGGASVALRKLVEDARKANEGKDRARQSQEAAYRFMTTMAGNEEGYEEALRALYAGKRKKMKKMMATWPADVREHVLRLAADALAGAGEESE